MCDWKKKFNKELDSLSGRYSRYTIFSDFIQMFTLAIANQTPSFFHEEREKRYLALAKKYTPDELDTFGKMGAMLIHAIRKNPNRDFLGELHMEQTFGSGARSQFFTHVYCTMAKLAGPLEKGPDEEYILVCDPACGAGALLIATANNYNGNAKKDLFLVGQNIDFLSGCMCYLQLSIMGYAGCVLIGDSLSNPPTENSINIKNPNAWFFPACFTAHWENQFTKEN